LQFAISLKPQVNKKHAVGTSAGPMILVATIEQLSKNKVWIRKNERLAASRERNNDIVQNFLVAMRCHETRFVANSFLKNFFSNA